MRFWRMVKPLRQGTVVRKGDVVCGRWYPPEMIYERMILTSGDIHGYVIAGVAGYRWADVTHRPDQRLWRADVDLNRPRVPMNENFAEPIGLP